MSAPDFSEDIVEVRCRGGLHFKVVEHATIEVKCKHCSDRDTVVLHRYSWPSMRPMPDIRFKELRGRGARPHRKESL